MSIKMRARGKKKIIIFAYHGSAVIGPNTHAQLQVGGKKREWTRRRCECVGRCVLPR